MNRFRDGILLILALLGAASGPVHAATISQLVDFDLNVPGATSGASLQTLSLNPFDPGLGSLDEVRVSIDGNVIHTGVVFGSLPYNVDVALDLTGLGSQFFSFSGSGLQIIHAGSFSYVSCSIAGCLPAAGPFVVPPVSFDLDFSFNRAFQELTGLNQGFVDNFAVTGSSSAAAPPIVINGAVSAFERSLINLNLMDVLMIRNVTGIFTNLNTDVFGTMSITYDYTPNPVPVPPAAWLFGTAIMGLTSYLRRIRRAA